MTQKSKNLPELDYINVWLCLAVILIHVLSNSLYGDFSPIPSDDPAYIPLFSAFKLAIYVVQGFIFLSALKYFYKFRDAKFNYPKFLWGRIKKVIIPYTVWFVIYAAYLHYRPDYTLEGRDLVRDYWQCSLIGHFYFIAVITQFYVLMPFWLRFFKKVSAALMLPLSLFINIIVLYIVPDLYYYYTGGQQFAFNASLFTTYFFFWCAGAYTGLYYERVTEYIQKHIPLIVSCMFISGAGIALYSYVISIKGHIMYFTDILYILYQTSVIFLLLALFGLLCRHTGRPPGVIRILSQSSYSIYLSHVLFIYAAEYYCSVNKITNSFTVMFIRAAAAYIICIILCMFFSTAKEFIKKPFIKKGAEQNG